MASGNKQMQYNFRERLVSDDHNREQQFIGADLASVFAHLYLATADADVGAGATETLSTTTDSPMTAAVLDGLRPSPINGTANMLVSNGVLVMSNPDASPSPDDRPQKWIVDPGVQLAGALTLTPGGGSTRIDVIECSRTTVVLESDNRDVFNPSTGLFSPVLLDKVTSGQLAYRVRTGTPGGGYPGGSAGWLPLAVASVPAGATTWDTVTLWDVRPLVSDRWNAPFATTTTMPRQSRTRVQTDTTTSAGHQRVYGQIDAQLGAYKAGGRIQTDAGAYLDLSDAQLPEPGYVFPGNASAPGIWNLWLCFPFGLPRWVRYAGSGTRVPQGLRGIPVLSAAAARWDGTPISTGPVLPTWTGLGGSTTQSQAVIALSGYTFPQASPYPLGVCSDGERVSTSDVAAGAAGLNPLPATTIPNAFDILTWTNVFKDGVTHPANARAIYVTFDAQMTTSGITWSVDLSFRCAFHFQVSGPDGDLTHEAMDATGPDWEQYLMTTANHASEFPPEWTRTVRIPLAPNLANPATARQFSVAWYAVLGNGLHALGATLSATANVVAWEVGP